MGQVADNNERRPVANREPVTAEAVAFLPPGSPTGRVPVAWRGFDGDLARLLRDDVVALEWHWPRIS